MSSIKSFHRHFIILICLLVSLPCMAKRVSGFIVTDNADTIYGHIKVYNFDRATGVLIINGIDMQCYHMEVAFKSEDENRFKIYKPQDIMGFGFYYQAREFEFHRFVLEPKNIFSRAGSKIYRFLSLEHSGKISLFRDIVRVTNPASGLMNNISNYFFDYYIYQVDSGLKKLQVSDEDMSLAEILAGYGFEKDFLEELPPETRLKDIKTVLERYDIWYEKKRMGS